MMLIRTHANRWIAREKRDRPAVGVITLLNPGEKRPVFRTEAIDLGSPERHLLRDADALEVALALLLARRARRELGLAA
ncbi:hypothetical protein HQQ81_13560 [Microbacteriaceae bacterium VKM Ac-2854]|nr:hypothetical protein [Microbacteriaceae bacterium VKM Ac-2854]